METKDGKIVLNLGHLRAGHWPGVKAPPWGIEEYLLSYSLKRRLTKEAEIQAFVPTRSNEFIPVTIRHREHPHHEGLNLFAFPDHAEDDRKWTNEAGAKDDA